MRRIVNLLIITLLPLALLAQTTSPSANEILRQFLSKIDAKTLTSSFLLTVTDDSGAPISYKGKLQMRGEKFSLSMLGNEGAFDGKTYYLYSEDTDELTLSTPTPEEIWQANPILFARELQKESRVRFAAANKDPKLYVIELIPNADGASGRKVTVKIRKADWIPLEVTEREGAQTTVVTFTDAAYSAEIPSFVISKPNAFINDLR